MRHSFKYLLGAFSPLQQISNLFDSLVLANLKVEFKTKIPKAFLPRNINLNISN